MGCKPTNREPKYIRLCNIKWVSLFLTSKQTIPFLHLYNKRWFTDDGINSSFTEMFSCTCMFRINSVFFPISCLTNNNDQWRIHGEGKWESSPLIMYVKLFSRCALHLFFSYLVFSLAIDPVKLKCIMSFWHTCLLILHYKSTCLFYKMQPFNFKI